MAPVARFIGAALIDFSWRPKRAGLCAGTPSAHTSCVACPMKVRGRSSRRLGEVTVGAAKKSSANSAPSGRRGDAGKAKPAVANPALMSKLASGKGEVALKEVVPALSAAKSSPDILWSMYTALRGRVAGGLDARRAPHLIRCALSETAAGARPASIRSYGLVIAGVAKGSGWDALKRAQEVHSDFLQAGFPNDAFVVAGLIAAHGRTGDTAGAQAVWDEAVASGVALDTRAMNALLSALARTGGLDTTRKAFENASASCGGLLGDGSTFAALVNAATREGNAAEALRLYEEGSAAGFGTDRALSSAALNACAAAGDAARAHGIFDRCKDAGLSLDLVSLNSVVTACARAADGDGAWLAFEKGRGLGLKPERDERIVSSVLCAFARTKEVPRAESFFRSVARAWPGNKPPEVCYLLLRDVAAAAGDEQAAKRISLLMQEELPKRGSGKGQSAAAAAAAESRRRAGIAPPEEEAGKPAHASASGDHAAAFADRARQPEGLAGPAGEGSAEGAPSREECESEEADEFEEGASVSGASEEGAGAISAVKRRRRVAAYATFTVGGVHYQTENGEAEAEGLPEGHPARTLLAGAGPDLIKAIRDGGSDYQPVLSGVLLMGGGDDAKRAALACHAEKKALGALILRSGDGEATETGSRKVRVNIRMCVDCHAAFEAASAVFRAGGPIVCVDGASAHTHRFENGVCSCGGRWR